MNTLSTKMLKLNELGCLKSWGFRNLTPPFFKHSHFKKSILHATLMRDAPRTTQYNLSKNANMFKADKLHMHSAVSSEHIQFDKSTLFYK